MTMPNADVFLAGAQPDIAEAEQALLSALAWMRRQSAMGWELRAAIRLARLRRQQGRAD